jgi:hypothetical protein
MGQDVGALINDALEKARENRLNQIISVMVACTATFVALCNVKDQNVVQAMQQAQANTNDSWAYFQAKSTKQNLTESMIDNLKIQRDTNPHLTPEGRAIIEKRIEHYTAKAKQYEVEKKEIKATAEGWHKKYELLNKRDDQFDVAEASLSIAIALFGVTALTKKRWLLAVAGAFAGLGFVIGVAGFLGKDLHPAFLAKLLSE